MDSSNHSFLIHIPRTIPPLHSAAALHIEVNDHHHILLSTRSSFQNINPLDLCICVLGMWRHYIFLSRLDLSSQPTSLSFIYDLFLCQIFKLELSINFLLDKLLLFSSIKRGPSTRKHRGPLYHYNIPPSLRSNDRNLKCSIYQRTSRGP